MTVDRSERPDPMTIYPVVPCCDYMDHSPGPCACSEHERSSLHPFGHLRLIGGTLTVGVYDWESDRFLVSEYHEVADAYRKPRSAPKPKPLYLAPWQQVLLEQEIGGPEEAERWAQSAGFTGIQDWGYGWPSLSEELRKIATDSEKLERLSEDMKCL